MEEMKNLNLYKMMKTMKFMACAMSAMMLAACGGASGSGEDAKDKQLDTVKMFVVDVATKVSKNQKDSVGTLYPDAAKADSLALTFVADSVKVAEIDSVTFSADFGGGKSLCVKKDAQGKLTVEQSKGLFVYPEKDLDFAKKTGMWTDSLTDAQFAERMATKEEFRNYLIKNFKVVNPLVMTEKKPIVHEGTCNMEYSVKQKYVVTNKSDKPVSGKDYKMAVRWYDIPYDQKTTEYAPGKDIAPGGSATYEWTSSYYVVVDNVSLKYNSTNKTQQFEDNFEPKGDEYQKFLDSKKK